jgi:hypothetical protein
MKYYFTAKVKRLVEDTVTLSVETDGDVDDAIETARIVAETYPNEHEESGVDYCYVENRDTLHSELTNLERLVPTSYDETA